MSDLIHPQPPYPVRTAVHYGGCSFPALTLPGLSRQPEVVFTPGFSTCVFGSKALPQREQKLSNSNSKIETPIISSETCTSKYNQKYHQVKSFILNHHIVLGRSRLKMFKGTAVTKRFLEGKALGWILGQEYKALTNMFLIFHFHFYAAERAFKSEMHFLRAAASWSGVMEAFTLPMIQSTMCFCSMRRSTFAVSTW